jgi:hypothetical protein
VGCAGHLLRKQCRFVDMSDDENLSGLIPCPAEGASPSWLGYALSVDFYPLIKISRKTGLEFAAELSGHLEPENLHLEGNEWKIFGGGVYEGMEVSVTANQLRSFVGRPGNGLEWYERAISAILRVFEQKFEPKAALQTNVMMSGLVDLPEGTDARVYIGGNLMLMLPHRLKAIGRPLEILGLRLFLPENETIDWSVNVRIESFGPDPHKVFVKADADWDAQSVWDETFADTAVARLTTVSQFMHGTLIQFLREPPLPDGEEST